MRILFLILLFATKAVAQISLGAPQGGAPVSLFPFESPDRPYIVVTDPPYNVAAGADASGGIQRALDHGGLVVFPGDALDYIGCALSLRTSVYLVGAGKDSSRIRGTQNCTNMFLTSSTAGPANAIGMANLSLLGRNSTNIVALNGRDVLRAEFRGLGVDLNSTGDTQGLLIQGTPDVTVDGVEFYSTAPGHGKPVVATRNPSNLTLKNNTAKWTYQGFEWGTEGTDGAMLLNNKVMLGWPFLPIKFSNSGGTVTYADGVLTDSGANFSGLCNDNGAAAPQTCGSSPPDGNLIRIMTSIATGSGSQTYNNGGNIITDSGANFTGAGVKEGDIVRTGLVCRGNGNLANTARASCNGSAGAGLWGDRCSCTANSDCGSGVCEARFSWVVGVTSATALRVDEWVGNGDRRPVGAPLNASYTVYSWVFCHVGSFTATTATCSNLTAAHFKDFNLGTVVTPSNGTLYEISTRHPNYPYLEQAAASNSQIIGNSSNWGYSDNYFTNGTAPQVVNNRSENCFDHCFNLAGTRCRISNNLARNFGARGLANFCPDSTMDGNIGMDGPVTATGTSNCPIVIGFTSGLSAQASDNEAINTKTLANSTSGICVQNQSDGVIISNPKCKGTFTTGCIRIDTVNNVNTHILGYHGETITGSGTYAIESGKTTQALLPAAQAGSVVGCSDCNVAAPCTSGGAGAIAIRSATGPAWNCR